MSYRFAPSGYSLTGLRPAAPLACWGFPAAICDAGTPENLPPVSPAERKFTILLLNYCHQQVNRLIP